VNLSDLAPSIPPLANTERAPDGYPDPANRLTVLLGAGASLYARAPSTRDLTAIVAQRELSGQVLETLRSNIPDTEPNFEDVLHVVEELESLAQSGARAPTMLRPFLEQIAPDIAAQALSAERFELIETIGASFRGVNYDESWRPLYALLRPLLDVFDMDIFTLNYDLIADVVTFAMSMLAGKKWFDGFGPPAKPLYSRDKTFYGLTFRPDQFAHWEASWGHNYLTLAHMHGSIGYAYYVPDQRMAHASRFELIGTNDPLVAQSTWRWAKKAKAEDPTIDFGGVTPIVSGLRKLEKLNVQPYANYFAEFARAVSNSPYLMIVGYGSGDEHINYWLHEFTLIHNEQARVVEITRSADPNRFAMQKFGAYDLQWSRFKGLENAFVNRAGVQCLTLTGGLTETSTFDENLINGAYSGKLH
jgi:hypothetical protein